MSNNIVLSVRVSHDMAKEIESIHWWENHSTLSQTLTMLLDYGIRAWKIRKGLNPNIILEIETK